MPHLIQPGAGEHSTHRSAAGLRNQANNQSDEGLECGGGEARAEHGQQTGQRARCDGAGRHRRTTLTRTVKERSMLSSSPSKIHEPLVIGVSPRLPDRRRRQELRNTRGVVSRRSLITVRAGVVTETIVRVVTLAAAVGRPTVETGDRTSGGLGAAGGVSGCAYTGTIRE